MLEGRGLEFTVREYLSDPLSREELGRLHELLGQHPLEWTRTGESEWTAAGLSGDAEAGEVLDAMAAAPKLLQRPVLITGGQARVGRPPTRLLELLAE